LREDALFAPEAAMICPKCTYERSDHDPALVPGVCPACGIAYNKWRQLQEPLPESRPALDEAELAARVQAEPPEPWRLKVLHYCGFMPSDRHESAFWTHIVLWVCFVVWGGYFILHGIDAAVLGGSVLHRVNLPFHEYGHLMFSPFGEFWMYLGGSLFQVLLPWFPLLYFMVWQRDNFAASLMLWWSGQNLLDVAPYIADAPQRLLPLLTHDVDAHDWWNLLRMLDAVDAAPLLALLCFGFGAGVILLSNFWGGFLLYVEWTGRTDPAFVTPTRDTTRRNAPP
jgi:hypothetical protein